jgi:hypothetical protein
MFVELIESTSKREQTTASRVSTFDSLTPHQAMPLLDTTSRNDQLKTSQVDLPSNAMLVSSDHRTHNAREDVKEYHKEFRSQLSSSLKGGEDAMQIDLTLV